MGQQQHSLPPVSRSGDPSWPAVAVTTVRLWLQRHSRSPRPPTSRRQRGVLVLSAIAAMALGALVTLVFTQPDRKAAPTAEQSEAAPPSTPDQLQIAAATRGRTAAWIKDQVLPGTDIACDTLMCNALTAAGVPAASLQILTQAAQDPLGSTIVVATPGVRNQFGSRLNSVYAPLLLASFGSGAERIDVWYLAPGGSADFKATLASDRSGRIAEGQQLLANKNIQATQASRDELLAGNVDPRLLITLSALAGEMPVRLVAFDDSSPGASVPLRGAEIGASASAGLAAMLSFLSVQRSQFKPSHYGEVKIAGGQSVVTVQYDAPGWMGPNGP